MQAQKKEIKVSIPLGVDEKNIDGFVKYLNKFLSVKNSKIIIDFSQNTFFTASFSAVLAAFIKLYMLNGNKVFIRKKFGNPKTKEILEKNKFLDTITKGDFNRFDIWDTTVPFKIYYNETEDEFADYIDRRFLGKILFPRMSKDLKNKILESLLEVFINAKEHSMSDYPHFSCGQFFPNEKKIIFTFVDLGIGFLGSIRNNLSYLINRYPELKEINNAKDAIEWSLKEGTSTKLYSSGGNGLFFIKEFIRVNKGMLQIISNNGFFELNCLDSCKTIKKSLNFSYNGTIINFIFRIDDNYYYLSSEREEVQ